MAGLICWCVSFFLWLDHVMLGGPRIPAAGRQWLRFLRTIRAFAVGILSLVILAFSSLWVPLARLSLDTYHTLEPPGPDGCRIILSVSRNGTTSGGQIYVKVPGIPFLKETGDSWRVEEDLDPVEAGTWSLVWSGGDARLRLWGRAGVDDSSIRNESGQVISCSG